MREARAEDARTEARRLIRDLLGEERPDAALLVHEAETALGADRVERCVELVRGAPSPGGPPSSPRWPGCWSAPASSARSGGGASAAASCPCRTRCSGPRPRSTRGST
ncbi:hypothetical protein ACFQX6_62255 [Streptosporangium lutulentum]